MRAGLASLLLLTSPLAAQTWTPGSRVHSLIVCARPDSLGAGLGICGTGGVLRAAGDKGTLTRGPTGALAKWGVSWFVHYDTPPDGWSSQAYLALDSLAVVPPPPPPNAVAAVQLNIAGTVMITTVGGTWQALATVRDAAGSVLAQPVTWRSTAPAVASVDATGLVTAQGVGTDTVWASAGGKAAYFLVLVGTPPPVVVPWSIRDSLLLTAPLFLKPPCLLVLIDGVTTRCGPYPVSATGTGAVIHHVTITVTVSP